MPSAGSCVQNRQNEGGCFDHRRDRHRQGTTARAVHHYSDRSDRAWVDVNCAALPHQLLESELFGYEKGAFSGADTPKPGMFELADGGTLFLDEIGELDLLDAGVVVARALTVPRITAWGAPGKWLSMSAL